MRDLEAGALVSHYRIVRRLGRGGMGEVFLADDLTLHRPVAIKFLIAPADEPARKRLLREARAVAALNHPCIAAVSEVGSDPADGDFIVMQYVEGETLAARLRRGRIGAPESLALAGQIAEALVVAHGAGIIHRDLKPQNIIVTPSGSPKLLDFGLARKLVAPEAAAEMDTASRLTLPDAVLGTPGYMSPEQIRSDPADSRSDLFALGCVLYECLTGRRPFTGKTTADLLGQVLHVEPRTVSSIVPELSPLHDALCARLLQKRPAERFQSAEEVLGAIRALTDSTKLSTAAGAHHANVVSRAAAGLSRTSRPMVIASTLVIVAALAGGAWEWRHRGVLVQAPADAVRWYDQGVEALREGAYAGARSRFKEAIAIFPTYGQAYSRLAEAESELDNERGAQAALVRVDGLIPDRTRLPSQDRLRLEAVRASVERDHAAAIAAYRQIAAASAKDASAWLDVGRAEESASHRAEARAAYEKALALDGQYAAVHLHLGILATQDGLKAPAMASFDEAIRLFQAGANVEGEAEALIGKGTALVNSGNRAQAREALDRAVQIAGDKYLFQRVRAEFELARSMSYDGKFDQAETLAENAVAAASDAGLHSVAADGLVDVGSVALSKGQFDKADRQLTRARALAADHAATKTEMRAQMQLASVRLNTGRMSESVDLAQPALKFFSDHNYARFKADAENIMSRALDGLGHYDEARTMAAGVLEFAKATANDALAADVLETLAGDSDSLGDLPAALEYRQREEGLHGALRAEAALPYDWCNMADLLIRLGHGGDAAELLAKVDAGIREGRDTYPKRPRRVAWLQTLRATVDGRFADVESAAAPAMVTGAKPDATATRAKVLVEYARAQLGRSRTAPEVIAGWATESESASAEVSYWVAQLLLLRNEKAIAYRVARDAWATPDGQSNAELRWRLAAVAQIASRAGGLLPGAPLPPREAQLTLEKLRTSWGDQAPQYFHRPDLAPLVISISRVVNH